MTSKRRAQQRLRALLKACGGRLDARAASELQGLPPGWAKLVDGMVSQAGEILTDDELATFRWTGFREEDGCLLVSWVGAGESADLIDQIVEAAAAEAAATCKECGLPALHGADEAQGPHCLLHASLEAAATEWKALATELRRSMQEMASRVPSSALAAKAVASALPALINEAQTYFRRPDGDASALLKQIREALQQLDRAVRRSGRVTNGA